MKTSADFEPIKPQNLNIDSSTASGTAELLAASLRQSLYPITINNTKIGCECWVWGEIDAFPKKLKNDLAQPITLLLGGKHILVDWSDWSDE